MSIVIAAGRRRLWSGNLPTPPSPPSAPTNVVAIAGDAQATVSWTVPSDGGSPITGYVITASPGGATLPVAAGSNSAVVTGLTDGQGYTFTVVAKNNYGTSPASAPSLVVTPQAASSGSGWTNPNTYDWVANTGVTKPWNQLALVYGSVTLSQANQFSSGSGTAADPFIYDGFHIRNDPTKNVFGNPTSCTTAVLNVNTSYVIVRNCRVPYVAGGSTNSTIRYENCEIGLWDYQGSTAPTVDRYTGNPIAQTAFRQFWFNDQTLEGYYIDPSIGVTSWTWGADQWKYMSSSQPTGAVAGAAWVKVYTGSPNYGVQPGDSYFRFDGTNWNSITATVCPDMVGTNNGYNIGGITPRGGAVIWKSRMYGVEDCVYFSGDSTIRVQLSWLRDNCTTRARDNPHGDMMQSVGGHGYYVQRCLVDAYGNRASALGIGSTRGMPYSSSGIFKTDAAPIDDILISECRIRNNSAHTLQFRVGPPKWYTSSTSNFISKAVSTGQLVTSSQRTATAHMYKCITAGTCGSTEPTWNTAPGSTTTDGTAVWQEMGLCYPTNVRLRNNVFDADTTICVDAGGETFNGIASGNTDTAGNPVGLGQRGIPSGNGWTDDGDPTGEGTTLK